MTTKFGWSLEAVSYSLTSTITNIIVNTSVLLVSLRNDAKWHVPTMATKGFERGGLNSRYLTTEKQYCKVIVFLG